MEYLEVARWRLLFLDAYCVSWAHFRVQRVPVIKNNIGAIYMLFWNGGDDK
jgi:hypothetical protein